MFNCRLTTTIKMLYFNSTFPRTWYFAMFTLNSFDVKSFSKSHIPIKLHTISYYTYSLLLKWILVCSLNMYICTNCIANAILSHSDTVDFLIGRCAILLIRWMIQQQQQQEKRLLFRLLRFLDFHGKHWQIHRSRISQCTRLCVTIRWR